MARALVSGKSRGHLMCLIALGSADILERVQSMLFNTSAHTESGKKKAKAATLPKEGGNPQRSQPDIYQHELFVLVT